MTPVERQRLVEAVHGAPNRLVLAIAGAGHGVVTDLLNVGGASRTVLEVRVPYAEAAMTELLALDPEAGTGADEPPAGAVSRPRAEAMARACLARAADLAATDAAEGGGDGGPVLGVACTAALVSDRPKRGDHRAHLAAADGDGVEHRFVPLEKGALDRPGEDRVVADALLQLIADRCRNADR